VEGVKGRLGEVASWGVIYGMRKVESYLPNEQTFMELAVQTTGIANAFMAEDPDDPELGLDPKKSRVAQAAIMQADEDYPGTDAASVLARNAAKARAMQQAGIEMGGRLDGITAAVDRESAAEIMSPAESFAATSSLVADDLAEGDSMSFLQKTQERSIRGLAALADKPLFYNANDFLVNMMTNTAVYKAMMANRDMIASTFDAGLNAASAWGRGTVTGALAGTAYSLQAFTQAVWVTGSMAAGMTWNAPLS